MQKIITLINWPIKGDQQGNTADKTPTRPMHLSLYQGRRGHYYEEETRPTYRIGKHNPADIQKAIDLAG